MKQIGFFVKDLSPGQLSFYLIKNLNDYIRKNSDISPIVFYENIIPFLSAPLCPMMQGIEVYGYSAPVMATTLSTAKKLLKSFGSKNKFYYVYDLEWIRPNAVRYEDFSEVFCSPEIKIIARNKDHADIIENCFNVKPIGMVEDFNIQDITKLCLG